MNVGLCVCVTGLAIMKISTAKINSLLWIEKAAFYQSFWQPLRVFFFKANVVHPQTGIPVNARA